MLIVILGLPGTGKSALAAALATRMGAVHLSIDLIEDALLGAGLPRSWETGVAANESARVMAEQNPCRGPPSSWTRSTTASRLARRGAPQPPTPERQLALVLPTLDDEAEHRRRLEGRLRDLAHVPEPPWEDVRARAAAFTPWADGACLRVAAERPSRGATRRPSRAAYSWRVELPRRVGAQPERRR